MVEKKDYKKWLKYAIEDYEKVKFGFYFEEKFELCCNAQQAIEKLFKGYLIMKGKEYTSTHDIYALCKYCAKYDEKFNSFRRYASILSKYYVDKRYPYTNSLESIDINIDNVMKFLEDVFEYVEPILWE